MRDLRLTDKIPREIRSNITKTIKASYFITNYKTWNIDNLKGCLPNYFFDKIMNIPILMNNVHDLLKIFMCW